MSSTDTVNDISLLSDTAYPTVAFAGPTTGVTGSTSNIIYYSQQTVDFSTWSNPEVLSAHTLFFSSIGLVVLSILF
jgi:hypothetical protein